MFYLTITAKRKNAKRHIATKGSYEECKRFAGNLADRYTVEIYNGKWELVERIK